MSRITKQIASDVAKKMTATKKETLKIKVNLYEETIFNEIKKAIPKEILSFYENHPRYTRVDNYVRISGNGFNYETVILNKYLPSPNSQTFEFMPDEKTAKPLLELKAEIEKMKIEIRNLVQEIEIAIFGLRTYKSVQENFPEAFEFLPTIQTTSLQLNISDLRQRINN